MNSTEIGRVTSSDGTSIAFERAGTGPAVILVDAAGNFRGFSPMPQLAEALSQDFTVFTYDRRGKGASTDTLPYSVDREIDDLQALIDAAGGSAFVHGFSSGAILALLAAEHGAGIAKLSLLEPPLRVEDTPPPPSGLGGEVAKLIITGRRGEAYERWLTGIGVPAEMIAGMRNSPLWPVLEATAHTLVYDSLITGSMPSGRLAAITSPALVLASDGSTEQLRNPTPPPGSCPAPGTACRRTTSRRRRRSSSPAGERSPAHTCQGARQSADQRQRWPQSPPDPAGSSVLGRNPYARAPKG